MSTNTAEWLLEISGLTVGSREGQSIDVVGQGIALAQQVRDSAVAYAAHASCTSAGCAPTCPLDGVDGGQAACRLARALAPVAVPTPGDTPATAAARFLQAVQAASTAVFHCRRHAHPAGECWFSGRFVDGAVEQCGDVLAVAHRVGH